MTACAWTGHVKECKVFNPIYMDKEDRVVESTARQLLEHNKSGKSVCGWKTVREQ